MKPLIEARDLSKAYGPCVANSHVSVSIEKGTIHAILGENGAGKSTFLKMLFGLIHPDSGEIRLDGELVDWKAPHEAIERGLGMVQQHFSLVETSSVIDNILLGAERTSFWGGLKREEAIKELESLLPSQSLKLPWYEKVENLSVGFKQRLEILKLFFRRSKILFLDEPTAVLTPQETDDLFSILRALKEKGHTIVLITHKIREVFELCESFTVMRGGKTVGHGRVKDCTEDQMIEMIIGRKLSTEVLERKAPLEQVAVLCEDISEEPCDKVCLKNINISLKCGEILGVAGVEGAGQQNLVEILMGTRKYSGRLEIMGERKSLSPKKIRSLGTGLIPGDRHHEAVWLNETCYTNMLIGLEDRYSRHSVIQMHEFKPKASEWAHKFKVEGPGLDSTVASLSGGNQQKLVFAREVGGRCPKFLICQHPVRGIDLGATERIHLEILKIRNEGTAVLLMSGDLDELMSLSDRMIVLFEGKIVGEFDRSQFDALKIGACMTGATT